MHDLRPIDYNGHVPGKHARSRPKWPAYRRRALILGLALWAGWGIVLTLALTGVI
jgi:hypothetical protein